MACLSQILICSGESKPTIQENDAIRLRQVCGFSLQTGSMWSRQIPVAAYDDGRDSEMVATAKITRSDVYGLGIEAPCTKIS